MTDKKNGTADHKSRQYALIKAMLAHVPFDGWGDAARAAAAEDLGLTREDAMGLIPDDATAIDVFTEYADLEMARSLDAMNPRPEKISVIIKSAILLRLENAEPHREAVSQTLKILARPQHAPLAAKTLYRTVDRIWRLTGDRATDFSFYTKRASLAGIYSATLLYWSLKSNPDRVKTEAFLDQRLSELALIPKITKPAKKVAERGFKLVSKMMGRMPTRRTG
jgi:ubiquinone biosynthesis protein COQ9